jgi:hypothetical protein
MADLALDPVSDAVYAALNVAALTALATGGISDDPAQGTTFPFVWYEVQEVPAGGFGTGALPEVTLRVHTYSRYEGMKEAQPIAKQIVALLRNQALTVAGYNHCGRVFYDGTFPAPNEELNGVKVHELVSLFRIYVEEA